MLCHGHRGRPAGGGWWGSILDINSSRSARGSSIMARARSNLLTTQQAGRTDWGPLSNRWTGNLHFSPFSIFWSSSTQRIPRPAHQACHNLDQNTSRKAGADLDHCSFLGSVHTGAKPKITVFRYKQILPVLLPAVPERTLL